MLSQHDHVLFVGWHPRNPSAFWGCILIASNGAAGWGSKLLVDEF
jgi:hypothetical protein